MTSLELHLRAETALRVYGAAEHATRAEDGSGRSADQRRVDWVVEQILSDWVGSRTDHRNVPDGDGSAGEGGAGGDTPTADDCAATGGSSDRRRRRPVQVQVVVPVAVALGISDEPCELVGYGPISAEHGRELLADAELRKVCVDTRTGQVVATDRDVVRPTVEPAATEPTATEPTAAPTAEPAVETAASGANGHDRDQALAAAIRQALVTMVLTPSYAADDPEPGYRPSTQLARTVRLRDVTCDFPFSSTPARRSDLDHTVPWPRGATQLNNLGARSRRIHRAKQAGWTPRPLPDGSLVWQSPSGAVYRRPPPRELPPLLPPDAALPSPRPPRRAEDPAPTGFEPRDSADDTGRSSAPLQEPGPPLPDDPPF